MKTQRITFIGAGNMAYSLIGGLIKQGVNPTDISAADPYPASLENVAKLGVKTFSNNLEAIANADAIVLAVKPQVMESVLSPLKAQLKQQQPLLISIAAGIDISSLTHWAGEHAIVRCMPNTPALVQLGASGLFANSLVNKKQRSLAETILNAVGISFWLNAESELDAVTAVSGSGPAYFFLLIEAMQQAAIDQGLSVETAQQLTLQTALGAATMASQSDVNASELRKRVTSPGGTTEQAINTFCEGGFTPLVSKAMQKCADHSVTLAKQLGA